MELFLDEFDHKSDEELFALQTTTENCKPENSQTNNWYLTEI